MAAFFTLGLQSQTTLETFFCLGAGGALVPSAPTEENFLNKSVSGVQNFKIEAEG